MLDKRLKVSSIIWRKRRGSGNCSSRYSTRLTSSGGISIDGAVRISVRRLAENFCPTSRSRLITTGSLMWRWKSFKTNTASSVMLSIFANACTGSREL
ncbi:MAG: hypothetical protein DMG90_11820 [Acidobacteria bacterium]|nr:MAG: hypothetical protein DMG90_11820 [Acidobacteriota bacterium]